MERLASISGRFFVVVSHIYSNFRRYLESPLILNSYTFFNSFISRGRSTLLPAVKLKPKAIFGRMFSEDQELYRVSVVVKHDDGKYLVHFIDFGNTEVKLQSELFNIPALVYIQHIFLIHSRTLLDFIQAFGAYD